MDAISVKVGNKGEVMKRVKSAEKEAQNCPNECVRLAQICDKGGQKDMALKLYKTAMHTYMSGESDPGTGKSVVLAVRRSIDLSDHANKEEVLAAAEKCYSIHSHLYPRDETAWLIVRARVLGKGACWTASPERWSEQVQ